MRYQHKTCRQKHKAYQKVIHTPIKPDSYNYYTDNTPTNSLCTNGSGLKITEKRTMKENVIGKIKIPTLKSEI